MKRTRVWGMSFCAVSMALLMTASAASAAVIGRERYSGEDSFTYECGDVLVEVEVQFSGTAHLRVGKGKDHSAFFLHDNYTVSEVHTSEFGTLFVNADGLFQETRGTRVPGFASRFLFSSVNSGQVFTLTDGNVLARDRGTVRETILFDTLGDDTPGGTFIADVDFELARIPILLRSLHRARLATDLIGSRSATRACENAPAMADLPPPNSVPSRAPRGVAAASRSTCPTWSIAARGVGPASSGGPFDARSHASTTAGAWWRSFS